MTVLILSSENDLHASRVAAKLDLLREPYQLLDIEDLLQGTCRFDLDKKTFEVAVQDKRLDMHSFTAVWNRRTRPIKSPRMPEEWVERLIAHESNKAWSGMLRAMNVLWVNRPDKQTEALLKIAQLNAAQQCGLRVPPSVVTNDPALVRSFFDSCQGAVIYKLIDEGSWFHFPQTETPRGLATMQLRNEDLRHLDQVRFSAHLFQKLIDKIADIRVTIVGRKLFAARIESQQGMGKLDFRLDYSVPISEFHLPDDIEASLYQLLGSLGLNFAAVDLCIDGNGDYYFFEANPAGQFLWIEEGLGLPICESLARLLAGADEPLV